MTGASEPYTLRWGILSCGKISKAFTKDLVLHKHPNITHHITAAATSNSSLRAEQFLDDCEVPGPCRSYGSYSELARDADVDVIYIGTPHSHHYQHARMCLEAGKHVLCEKAFTVNAAQARELVRIAKEKKLFLMEAVWTRFFPLTLEILDAIKQGTIGDVYRVTADNSFYGGLDELELENRMVNVDLAGGALLDLGIYSITWIFLVLYHLHPAEKRAKPAVASAMSLFHTGADEASSVIMSFPTNGAHGIATTHLRIASNPDNQHTAGPAIRISGTKGEIQIYGPAFRPTRYRIVPADHNTVLEYTEKTHEIEGTGLYWEADEVAKCLRDGKLESDGIDWEESVTIMEVMDEVRKQGGLTYPDKIESLEYPLPGF